MVLRLGAPTRDPPWKGGGKRAILSAWMRIVGFCLSVNGEAVQVPEGTSVAGLLERLGLDGRKVAVERNEEIVPRSVYETTVLVGTDQVEIVHFIGGG